jgi:hypothetical protein
MAALMTLWSAELIDNIYIATTLLELIDIMCNSNYRYPQFVLWSGYKKFQVLESTVRIVLCFRQRLSAEADEDVRGWCSLPPDHVVTDALTMTVMRWSSSIKIVGHRVASTQHKDHRWGCCWQENNWDVHVLRWSKLLFILWLLLWASFYFFYAIHVLDLEYQFGHVLL